MLLLKPIVIAACQTCLSGLISQKMTQSEEPESTFVVAQVCADGEGFGIARRGVALDDDGDP